MKQEPSFNEKKPEDEKMLQFFRAFHDEVVAAAEEPINHLLVEEIKKGLAAEEWKREDILAYVSKEDNQQSLRNDPNLTLAFFELLNDTSI